MFRVGDRVKAIESIHDGWGNYDIVAGNIYTVLWTDRDNGPNQIVSINETQAAKKIGLFAKRFELVKDVSRETVEISRLISRLLNTAITQYVNGYSHFFEDATIAQLENVAQLFFDRAYDDVTKPLELKMKD